MLVAPPAPAASGVGVVWLVCSRCAVSLYDATSPTASLQHRVDVQHRTDEVNVAPAVSSPSATSYASRAHSMIMTTIGLLLRRALRAREAATPPGSGSRLPAGSGLVPLGEEASSCGSGALDRDPGIHLHHCSGTSSTLSRMYHPCEAPPVTIHMCRRRATGVYTFTVPVPRRPFVITVGTGGGCSNSNPRCVRVRQARATEMQASCSAQARSMLSRPACVMHAHSTRHVSFAQRAAQGSDQSSRGCQPVL